MVHASRAAFTDGGMRGSPKTQHARNWSSLDAFSNWKLYENPFFREAYLVPSAFPHRQSSPHSPWSTDSSSAVAAQCGSNYSDSKLFNVPSSEQSVKTHEVCDVPSTDPNSSQSPLQIPSDKEKLMSGSIVSARKLAAAFWEQYGVQTLQKSNSVHQASDAEDEHSHILFPPTRMPPPPNSSFCEIPISPENAIGSNGSPCERNMATCQTTALVNVLHRVMSVEDVQGRHTAVLQKLKSDLEDVVRHVVELQSSHASTLKEVSSSLQKFKEQMVICRRKEREKMQLSVLQLRQEMEEEKNTCRILKLKNKKLAEELSTANRASEDACEALERERKAREMLEEVCNELAREIGKDKAEVEILKQEQEESRKRLEEELKVMRMAVLWQDEVVKNGNTSEISGRVSEDNDKQFVPVREELRSKLEAFMEAFGTCRSKSDLGIMDRQAEQSRLYSQAFQLVDLAASGKSENEDGEAGPKACPANDSSCSNACSSGQENASHVIGIEQNGDAADILQHGAGKYSDQGKISFSSKNQRSWRSRCAIRNRTQRRYGFSQEGSEEWGNTDTSDLQSSEDDFENQMQLTNYYNCTLEMRQKDKDHDCIVNVSSDLVRNHVSSHGGRLSETPSSNHSGLTKESYCPSDKFAKSSGSSHFGIGRHTNSVSGLETDMATSIPRDQYEDDAMSCLMKGAASKGEQNNTVRPPREQDEGSRVGKIQDCSMYPHNNDLDLCSGPVGSSISVHPELNRSRQRSENRTANLGTKDLQNNTEGAWLQDANENAMRRASSITSLTFFGSPERNKIKADANASYYDHGSKTSSWHSSPAKSLLQPQIWLPSADSFSSFGGSTKCSSLNIEEEQREVTNSSSVHPFSHSQESSASKETANEQQSLCIKGNSLGAHLIKAREPEDELKPVKSLFRSSPLRRTILYD